MREGEGKRLMWARLEPFDGYKLTFEIDFDHPAVSQTGQHVVFDMGSGQYKREIARARTFGFTKDVEMMRSRGLGLGGSMDNVVVVDDHKVLNVGGLRYDDEFVKHKMLDAIGDMYMIGHPLIAAYSAFKSGHASEQPAAARLARRSVGLRDRQLRRRRQGAARPGRTGAGMVRRSRLSETVRDGDFPRADPGRPAGRADLFRAYAWTGEMRWRHRGLRVISWTVGSRAGLFRGAVRAAADRDDVTRRLPSVPSRPPEEAGDVQAGARSR